MKPDPFAPKQEHRFSDPVWIGRPATLELHHYLDEPGTFGRWVARTKYPGSEWLFVKRLRLLVDGIPYDIEDDGNPVREVGPYGGVYEWNRFPLPPNIVEDVLQKADSVLVRLDGQHFYHQGVVTGQDLANLVWFVSWVHANTAPIGPQGVETEQ